MKEANGKFTLLARQLSLVVLAIFFSEAAVMILVNFFQLDAKTAIIVDPFLLLMFMIPIMLFFVFRPMDDLLGENRQKETGFKLVKGELEARLEEQYRKLMQKNKAMTWEMAARMKVEDELREKKAFLETVIESLDHPFYVIDASNYQIILTNSAAGFSDSEKCGTCYQLTHNLDEPCRAEGGNPCLLQEVVKTGKAQSAKHVHYDVQGNPHEVKVHTQPVFNAAGKVTHVIEFILDCTEVKER